jgi:hypothetical protein
MQSKITQSTSVSPSGYQILKEGNEIYLKTIEELNAKIDKLKS